VGRAFFVGSAAALALCVAFPFLLPFVLAGILVGLFPRLLTAAWEGARRFRRRTGRDLGRASRPVIAITTAVAAVVSAVWLVGLLFAALSDLQFGSGSGEPERAERSAELPVTYRGRGTYDDGPERLMIEDRVSIELADVLKQAENYVLLRTGRAAGPAYVRSASAATFRKLERLVAAEFTARGWQQAPGTTAHDLFVKERTVPLRSRSIPVDTGNEIRLPSLPDSRPGAEPPFVLSMADRSQLVLTAPVHTFDSTRPASERDEHLTGDREDRTLPLAGITTVEVDVRSPWFRSGVTSATVGWALSGGRALIGILIGILIAVLSEPVQDWLRRRLGIRKRR